MFYIDHFHFYVLLLCITIEGFSTFLAPKFYHIFLIIGGSQLLLLLPLNILWKIFCDIIIRG